MTELNIEHLKSAALAATPGDWIFSGTATEAQIKDAGGCLLARTSWHTSNRLHYTLQKESIANAAFIAASNPAAVLELIAEIERLRAAQGSAEPVATVVSYNARKDTSTINKYLPPGTVLFTAPPAPVSAEPVFVPFPEMPPSVVKHPALGPMWDRLEMHFYASKYAEQRVKAALAASASPSTDAKDNE